MVINQDGSPNGALTVTLPGVADRVHAIRRIYIYRTATLSVAGNATLAITTSNLPASLGWTVGNGINAGGSVTDVNDQYQASPLISLASGVDSVFSLPAPGLGVSWHAVIHYDLASQ